MLGLLATRMEKELNQEPFSPRELWAAAASLAVLAWINVYICRELFQGSQAHMNSMHGFWTAIARLGEGWFRAGWWPYWDCGIPFEFTYAPLVPWLTSAVAAVRGVPHDAAFQSISGFFYCLIPLTLFLMAWLLTRAPGYSFAAAMVYSLAAPTQLLAPDERFALARVWDARRLYIAAAWDETPHLAALALLPLVVLFLVLAFRKGRLVYCAAAAVAVALAALASAFGPVMVAMAVLCLLFVLGRERLGRNLALTAAIGAFGYALAAPFLSPSILRAMRASAPAGGSGWTMGSVTALAIVVLGWVALWRWLPRRTKDWRLQFFALFAYATGSVPLIHHFWNRHFLPQPSRYKVEFELALALLLVFALRPWFSRRSAALRAAIVFLLLALAGEQVVSHRRFAKNVLRTPEVAGTIEYRAAAWAERNLPGVRVMLPGSMAQWGNAYTGIHQFGGGSWSMAYNQSQQRALAGIYHGGDSEEQDARVALAWLRAYGVGVVAVSGPGSPEFWKPFKHPNKFAGRLPVLWREEDTTIYQVPRRTPSLAHVVPESALVRRQPRGPRDIAGVERYVEALENPAYPEAGFRWEGRNTLRVQTRAARGQAISLQVSHHPGWRATVNGRPRSLERDGLGLMWLRPECDGPCEVLLHYDGGWELRICRYLSFAALAALLVAPFLIRRLAGFRSSGG